MNKGFSILSVLMGLTFVGIVSMSLPGLARIRQNAFRQQRVAGEVRKVELMLNALLADGGQIVDCPPPTLGKCLSSLDVNRLTAFDLANPLFQFVNLSPTHPVLFDSALNTYKIPLRVKLTVPHMKLQFTEKELGVLMPAPASASCAGEDPILVGFNGDGSAICKSIQDFAEVSEEAILPFDLSQVEFAQGTYRCKNIGYQLVQEGGRSGRFSCQAIGSQQGTIACPPGQVISSLTYISNNGRLSYECRDRADIAKLLAGAAP